MAAFVNALDNYTSQQIGENGHVEYGWSNNLQEKIVQLSFQVTRTDDSGLVGLRNVLSGMLTTLKHQLQTGSLPEKEVAKGFLTILYKMIGQTRDIVDGKGECALSYMMLHTWHQFFPQLALFALKCLVDLGDKAVHQYGSWKDLKYFCAYCKKQGEGIDYSMIQEAIRLTNEQLYKDVLADSTGMSLAAKWVPREKSSFGWLYHELATNYFQEYMATADSEQRSVRAVLKCKTDYRKLISSLNKKLDTLQIKQCANTWSDIDFGKVTSVSLGKQKKAFLNVDKKNGARYPDREDRVQCALNFNTHVQKAVKGEVEMKGARVGMADFTKQARKLNIAQLNSQVEKDLLNSQWRDNSKLTGALENMIPMVDLSGSMAGDPMDVAIAMGIRIAEKSKLGKRVMTFTMNPRWVNLEPYPDFVSQVKAIEAGDIGYNTDFHKALNLILDTIVENKMEPEDVENMTLVILSDMQIDQAEQGDPYSSSRNGAKKREAIYDSIKEKYTAAGMRVHGKPYKPPHILFWNLRNTTGFPCLSNEKNVSMMSGFSPALLKLFCDNGTDALQSCTPWSILTQSLENNRYKILGDYLESIHLS